MKLNIKSIFKKNTDALDPISLEKVRPFFDNNFYSLNNPDVIEKNVDPLYHYVVWGWREGRNPNSWFSTEDYLKEHPYLIQENICPLCHYADQVDRSISTAKSEVGSNFLEQAVVTKEQNFIKEARNQKNSLLNNQIASLCTAIGVDFNLESYAKRWNFIVNMYFCNKDLEKERGGSTSLREFSEYILFDLPRGKSPGPLFDPDFYQEAIKSKDMPEKGLDDEDGFLHWLEYGIETQIIPNMIFSDECYLNLNSDLKLYPGWLFEHWLNHGIEERRSFMRNVRLSGASWAADHMPDPNIFRNTVNRISTVEVSESIFSEMESFRTSDVFVKFLAEANETDPHVSNVTDSTQTLYAPFHDAYYLAFKNIISKTKKRSYTNIVLVPFCKMGGADYVSGLLTKNLDGQETLVIRTDRPDWERSDWFNADSDVLDLSKEFSIVPRDIAQRALYELIRFHEPEHVFNVNSALAFETLARFGERMVYFTKTFCYYFCADFTKDGEESGYPVWYFSPLIPHLHGALIDNSYLAQRLKQRFCLPPELASKVHVLYSPMHSQEQHEPAVEAQIASVKTRKRSKILWAGRLDRQKRFDLVQEIAALLPDIDFECWGKAVLDTPPDLDDLPENLTLNPPFESFDELPFEDSDLWLYTSAWDGIPTILIECAARGVPIVASGVGGVPEIMSDHGWVLPEDATPQDYADTITAALEDAEARHTKALDLQAHTLVQHGIDAYRKDLAAILGTPMTERG